MFKTQRRFTDSGAYHQGKRKRKNQAIKKWTGDGRKNRSAAATGFGLY
jgi:hypothetical protein